MGNEAKRRAEEKHDARVANKGTRAKSYRSTTEVADWGGADAKKVLRAIEVVAKAGGALRFGYTRDGGAYAIGVMGDGEPYSEYVKPSENIDEFLERIILAWE